MTKSNDMDDLELSSKINTVIDEFKTLYNKIEQYNVSKADIVIGNKGKFNQEQVIEFTKGNIKTFIELLERLKQSTQTPGELPILDNVLSLIKQTKEIDNKFAMELNSYYLQLRPLLQNKDGLLETIYPSGIEAEPEGSEAKSEGGNITHKNKRKSRRSTKSKRPSKTKHTRKPRYPHKKKYYY
jgi:hypothetical protein